MANLTETAYLARRIIKYGGLGIIILALGQSILAGVITAYRKAYPAYTPPTTRYGKLPVVAFPLKSYEKKSFSLELADDAFPKFADQAKVYIVYRPVGTLLALEADTQTAKDLGFLTAPREVATGVYEFKNDNLNQTLTMNVLEGSFKLSYPYLTDQMLTNPDKMPSKEEAVEAAKSFLENANKLSDDLDDGVQKVSYWKINFDGLREAASLSDANIIRVDFFRKDLENEAKIMPSEVGKASVSVLVSGATVAGKKIVEVNYKYSPIDRQSFSTYPIKKIDDVWAEVQAGGYWPTNDVTEGSVIIRKVSLAYFEPSTLTNYMQPIFVFEGDKGFTAYVPAVKDEWVTK